MNRRTVVFALALCAGALVSAQAPKQFKGRLSVVPLDVAAQATIAGSGTVTATLNGTTLTVNGTFSGLKSNATVARVHDSLKPGMRGKPVADLKVTAGMSGTITGTVELSPDQVTAAGASRLYVQLHSEKAPDGNLWGWLFLQEAKK